MSVDHEGNMRTGSPSTVGPARHRRASQTVPEVKHVWERPDRSHTRAVRPAGSILGEEVADPLHPGDDVLVRQGVGQPQVARGTKGLTGNDGDLGLGENELGQLR